MNNHLKNGIVLFYVLTIFLTGCDKISAIKTENDIKTTALLSETSNQANQLESSEQTYIATEDSVPVSAIVTESNFGDNIPVSRGLVAKMLSMTFNDLNSINTLSREISFSDTSVDKWYDRYINTSFICGYMQGNDKGMFMPEEAITLSQAQTLMNKLNPNNKVKVQLTEETKDKPISYALWTDLYKKFIEDMSGEKSIKEVYNIEEKRFVVLATPGNNNQLKDWCMITDKGPLTFYGLNMDSYIDKEIRVLQKDNDVLAVLSVENESPTIYNSYIVRTDNNSITVFSGGSERTYAYPNPPLDCQGKICDIKISNGKATELQFYDEVISDFVMKTTFAEMELKNSGILYVGENLKIYSIEGGYVKWKQLNDIIVGTDTASLILKDGKISAVVINRKPPLDKIRVALSTTNFGSLSHKEVTVTCDTDYNITSGENSKSYKKGEIVTVTNDMFSGKNRIYITPVSSDGRIQITSIKRNWEGNVSPKYRGIIEISKADNEFYIVNEVGIEQYLYAVVPSEMPSGYGVEASKVQAVTARSYANNQFYANRYHSYGANVDDSVSCQVYNNIPENDISIAAVNDTKGQCIAYNGQVISANFFSTSSGVTSNSGEVWADNTTKYFPTATKPYLISQKQYSDKNDYGDLSIEANASKFFKEQNINAYDSSFPWFRWNTEMTSAEIAASINANLEERYNSNPSLIKTLQEGNVFRSTPISSIGELKTLEVTKRGEGGNIMEMKVAGTKATILIQTEYNIRALIRPKQYISGEREIILNKKDGSKNSNYSIMPSAFYVIERMTDFNGNIVSVKFFGGGNGHGTGMSQNGVKGMIDEGFTFEQILKHYYAGTEVISVASNQ